MAWSEGLHHPCHSRACGNPERKRGDRIQEIEVRSQNKEKKCHCDKYIPN